MKKQRTPENQFAREQLSDVRHKLWTEHRIIMEGNEWKKITSLCLDKMIEALNDSGIVEGELIEFYKGAKQELKSGHIIVNW